MILRGGIFNGFGAFDASSLMIALDPKAGAGAPLTSLLQGVLQQRGASKLAVDGKWGQCSHSAFNKVFGVPPSSDALNQVFALDKFGVPSANVSVWKPGVTDICWGGSDAYEAPPVEQQLANPAPAFLFADLFGLSIPAGLCTDGRIPGAAQKQCVCPTGMYEDLTTGKCAAFEQPAKLGPAVVTKTPQKVVRMPSSTAVSKVVASVPPAATTSIAAKASAPSNLSFSRVGSGLNLQKVTVGGAVTQTQPASGSQAGTIAILGIGVVVVAGGAWLLLRKKAPAQAVANRRRRHHRRHCRRNCGYRSNCGE
jgi:hypothetical protein